MIHIIQPSRRKFLAALAAATGGSVLAGCAGISSDGTSMAGQASPAPKVLREEVGAGLYELAVVGDEVHVASNAGAFGANRPGALLVLDGKTLELRRRIELPLSVYGLTYAPRTRKLYAGHTFDGAVSIIDPAAGRVERTLRLSAPDAKGNYAHVRQMAVDERHGRVFVSNPDREGVVWIADTRTGEVQHKAGPIAKWPSGLAYDDTHNRLYVGQGGDKGVAVVDPDSGRILQQFVVSQQECFLINVDLDRDRQRLLAINGNTGELLGLDTTSGKVIQAAPVGPGALDVLFNPRRSEIYATYRGVTRERPDGTGGVIVFDAGSFEVKHRIDLPVHPNSLALSEDAQVLYVSIKVPHEDKHPAWRKGAVDSVARIALS